MAVEPRFPRILWRLARRYLMRHPWQSVLMILGITLGVAVVVSIDLANSSAARAFDLSTEAVTGRATHQITGGPDGIPERYYAELRTSGAAVPAAPVVVADAVSRQLGNRPFQLLGIDPFAESPFRSYLGGAQAPELNQLESFLTRPGAVLLSASVAQRYGLQSGDSFSIQVAGRTQEVFVSGLLQPNDALARRTLDGLILADISTAQEISGKIGVLDRIDLIFPGNTSFQVHDLIPDAPSNLTLEPVAARTGTVAEMSAAFRLNLSALSMLALLVGLFLIYNTMTFSVVQRRALFGSLRSLGVTRREIFTLVLVEALLTGLTGSALGIALGIWMGQGTVRMVSQTITDLYFASTVTDVGLPVSSLLKGGLVGVLATLLTTIPPAYEASTVPPRIALLRSSLESKTRTSTKWIFVAALVLIAVGGLLFTLPIQGLVAGFSGTFAVVTGFAMLSPVALVGFMRLVGPVTGRVAGFLGRLAPRNLINALSRTSVAVAALMIAVAVTIGVSLMINSFRYTVVSWLDQTLQGDIYLSVPSLTATRASAAIDPAVAGWVKNWPGVARVDQLRSVQVNSPDGPITVSATDNQLLGSERRFLWSSVPSNQVWQELSKGGIIVSEPLARRLSIPRQGGEVTLNTLAGPKVFPVVGVYYDYASSQGVVMMSLSVYRSLWQDDAVTAIDLRLKPGMDATQISQNLQDNLPMTQVLSIRPNLDLKKDVMAVFDRTFAITGALQILATVVAFIGVLSAVMLLQLEKQREIGILRAMGLTARQLWALVTLESGLMGIVAGLLAVPTGYVLSLILVYVINQRSFGWTLQMDLGPEPFLQGLLVAVAASLLAGIYPARKLGRMVAAEAIRFE